MKAKRSLLAFVILSLVLATSGYALWNGLQIRVTGSIIEAGSPTQFVCDITGSHGETMSCMHEYSPSETQTLAFSVIDITQSLDPLCSWELGKDIIASCSVNTGPSFPCEGFIQEFPAGVVTEFWTMFKFSDKICPTNMIDITILGIENSD